jgi:hypothetical protein
MLPAAVVVSSRDPSVAISGEIDDGIKEGITDPIMS